MLTGSQELERLRAGAGDPSASAPGFVESLLVEADRPDQVVERAQTVLAAVIKGGEDGLAPGNPAWVQALPGWFVAACSPEQTDDERETWLARWRALDRAGKAAAEAGRGWTLRDWLAALDPQMRAWRWWACDGARVSVVVDGWPAPLAALEWLLTAAGARSLRSQ